ncbi:MAG: cell division protein FtsL [Succinivibrio sp.]|nr:cell division protein FtsL [Succinivibrio sp.]
MQNSTALRINNTQPVAGKEKDNPSQRPQFGRRANPDIKPVVPQVNTPEVETRVDVEQIIHVSAPTLSFNTDNEVSLISYASFQSEKQINSPKLLKEVLKDFSRNFVAYALIIAVSAVSVIKVHQVQRTRDLTIQYNEVKRYNDTLMREQLNLLATRENYTEYSIIRNRAINKLGMVAVKTEDETVIDLR